MSKGLQRDPMPRAGLSQSVGGGVLFSQRPHRQLPKHVQTPVHVESLRRLGWHQLGSTFHFSSPFSMFSLRAHPSLCFASFRCLCFVVMPLAGHTPATVGIIRIIASREPPTNRHARRSVLGGLLHRWGGSFGFSHRGTTKERSFFAASQGDARCPFCEAEVFQL